MTAVSRRTGAASKTATDPARDPRGWPDLGDLRGGDGRGDRAPVPPARGGLGGRGRGRFAWPGSVAGRCRADRGRQGHGRLSLPDRHDAAQRDRASAGPVRLDRRDRRARRAGSPVRLFALVYVTGIVTTTFLSNDATAVVLTPAVYAAARKAKADPLPLLFACALIANAASFVLPISNPANLVLYGGTMPPLGQWFASFALPSVAAIVVTYGALRWTERARLVGQCETEIARTPLTIGGKAALAGIVVTAVVLLLASAFDVQLGLPTCIAGVATTIAICLLVRMSPLMVVRDVSWSVLPLVAGLFVLVEALDHSGVIGHVAAWLRAESADPARAAMTAGTLLAFGSNLVNNLPAGLIASTAVAQAQPPRVVVDALLIGVDLGPNLSITGSLATILWLQAIRREGLDIGFLRFLKVGAVTMIPALTAALGTRLLIG
ncbi:SLC13 family permease [Sphingomonas aerolata]